MNKAIILMSTYNGRDKIVRQTESILNQINIDVEVLIRDDGSEKETVEILEALEGKSHGKVKVVFGDNIGWKKSFLELLWLSDDADYYGFSDQDDVWMPNKISSCIEMMESEAEPPNSVKSADGVKNTDCITPINAVNPSNTIKLCHCTCVCADEDLTPRPEQENRVPCPLSHKSAFATEYFQGCGMLWNKAAMELIRRYKPQDENISHDYWVGLVCYLFGAVYFCPTPLFYHIRYNNSCSSDGDVNKGRMKRLKAVLTGKEAYMNPAQDLLNGYRDILDKEDYDFLEAMSTYKMKPESKRMVLCDREFARNSIFSTLLLKAAILVNRY